MLRYDLDPTKCYHLAQCDVVLDTGIVYQQHERFDSLIPLTIKPRGLWYAWGRTWLDGVGWLSTISDERLAALFELTIDTSKFVQLANAAEALEFQQTYGYHLDTDDDSVVGIDWNRVTADYDGIEVSPWDKSCELFWYQTFDLTSGCVWNLNALQQTTRMKLDPYEPQSTDNDTNIGNHSPIGL